MTFYVSRETKQANSHQKVISHLYQKKSAAIEINEQK